MRLAATLAPGGRGDLPLRVRAPPDPGPFHAEVRVHLGIALAETGQTGEGRTQIRAALQERPSLQTLPEVVRWR